MAALTKKVCDICRKDKVKAGWSLWRGSSNNAYPATLTMKLVHARAGWGRGSDLPYFNELSLNEICLECYDALLPVLKEFVEGFVAKVEELRAGSGE